jgi:glucose-specific phosphotransferase system IIA component
MTTMPSYPTGTTGTPRSRLLVAAPVRGTAIPLSRVPDPVFAGIMVGPGAAVDPARVRQHAVAPMAGWLVKLKPHAYVVGRDDGRHVLVHLGIDTIGLGDDFEPLLAEGDRVESGTPIVTWDPGVVAAHGLSPICAVVALGTPESAISVVAGDAARAIAAGDPLFRWS